MKMVGDCNRSFGKVVAVDKADDFGTLIGNYMDLYSKYGI